MEMRNFPFGFHVQVNRVFAVCQIGRTGTDFPVLAGNRLFVELFGELVPELLPVLNVIETGMLGRRAQLDADDGILDRPMLGKGQLHEFQISAASSARGGRLSCTREIFSRSLLLHDSPHRFDAVRDGFGFCDYFSSSGLGVDGTPFCSRAAVRKQLTASAIGRSFMSYPTKNAISIRCIEAGGDYLNYAQPLSSSQYGTEEALHHQNVQIIGQVNSYMERGI